MASHKLNTLGASNLSVNERDPMDFYATEPQAVYDLLEVEKFQNPILEPCCGQLHISNILEEAGYDVESSDLVDRLVGAKVQDFFEIKEWNGDIVTNPPYGKALDFVKHALDIVPAGKKVVMFLRLLFLEGKTRRQFFEENPPKTVYVASSRYVCAKAGDFENIKGSAVAFAWFVWEKGFKGNPEIKWIH